MRHLIFYDGECPLCNRAVRFILEADAKKIFCFAPLGGVTAKKKMSFLHLKRPDLDTLVLLEKYETADERIYIEGRGALRILWLLGGKYGWIGWLFFLPGFLSNPIYRWIARRRYKLFTKTVTIQPDPNRFMD